MIEPERDVAKAELQDAMDQAAARVCGSDAISEDLATWHDIVLQVWCHRSILWALCAVRLRRRLAECSAVSPKPRLPQLWEGGRRTRALTLGATLQAAGNTFLVHRAVLYGRSELFSVMLQNPNFREGQAIQSRESISLQDMEPAALQTVLRWMYSDRVKASLPPDHLLEVRGSFLGLSDRPEVFQGLACTRLPSAAEGSGNNGV